VNTSADKNQPQSLKEDGGHKSNLEHVNDNNSKRAIGWMLQERTSRILFNLGNFSYCHPSFDDEPNLE